MCVDFTILNITHNLAQLDPTNPDFWKNLCKIFLHFWCIEDSLWAFRALSPRVDNFQWLSLRGSHPTLFKFKNLTQILFTESIIIFLFYFQTFVYQLFVPWEAAIHPLQLQKLKTTSFHWICFLLFNNLFNYLSFNLMIYLSLRGSPVFHFHLSKTAGVGDFEKNKWITWKKAVALKRQQMGGHWSTFAPFCTKPRGNPFTNL